MTITEPDWTAHARGLADLLRDRGAIVSPRWHAAFAAVPRHSFIHRVYEQDSDSRWIHWDAETHWDRVYAPKTLVTALDDRRGHPEPASSSTNPELMARMLENLDIHDGHRVLEIGTGTGYNAALLSHRLGDGNVFSVDIDARLVELARKNLSDAGYRPTLAAVDGGLGLAQHAPYDHILATCSVPAVPKAWLDQLTDHASILVDLKRATGAGNLVHLHRQGAGRAEGRFVARFASFMAMRHNDDDAVAIPRADDAPGERRFTTEAPTLPWAEPVLWFLAQLSGLPRDITFGTLLSPERRPYAATITSADGSWARVDLADRTVTEAGPSSLWLPVERAHRLWTAADHPGWPRLGLTVDADGRNTVWLDSPAARQNWVLSAS
ncbi:methyltransferase domain-containing protein [Amycolatopsis sp. cg5]|uniref:methyltransferase domain-containing protein n=1 Tax=Amycolatopsis sp. cg5 TaxID=3238802 RepID=UPI00352338D8